MAQRVQNLGVWLIGMLFLAGIAIYNGYPLVTSDTGTYINSAFSMEVARDRPFAYSLLIRATSLKFSLWLPVIFQTMILLYLINQLVSQFLGDGKNRNLSKVGIIAFISIFTGAGWYSGMIMPDIFAPIGALALLLFILEQNPGKLVFYALLLLFAVATHTSHLLIFTLLAIFIFLFDGKQRKMQRGKYLVMVAIPLSAWLLVPTLHWTVGGKFSTNESTHVFLTGRFLETGTLHRYLDNECAIDPMPLCDYRYELPSNAIGFIWSPESPLYKTNGWEDPDHGYRNMVRNILLSPRYNLQFLYASFFHSLTQLLQTDVGDGLGPHVAESNPFWKVQQYFPAELPTFLHSRQNTSNLSFNIQNLVYRWITLLSVLYLLWLLWNKARAELTSRDKQAIWICIGVVVLNAFVTATFGNILARLQSRISWIIPLIAMIMWIKYSRPFSSSLRKPG